MPLGPYARRLRYESRTIVDILNKQDPPQLMIAGKLYHVATLFWLGVNADGKVIRNPYPATVLLCNDIAIANERHSFSLDGTPYIVTGSGYVDADENHIAIASKPTLEVFERDIPSIYSALQQHA